MTQFFCSIPGFILILNRNILLLYSKELQQQAFSICLILTWIVDVHLGLVYSFHLIFLFVQMSLRSFQNPRPPIDCSNKTFHKMHYLYIFYKRWTLKASRNSINQYAKTITKFLDFQFQ